MTLLRATSSRIGGRKPVIAIPGDPGHCALGAITRFGGSTTSSTAWTGANVAIAMPFYVYEECTALKLAWVNGSAAGDNWDIGLYDAALTKLVSAGSTAGTGNSVPQWVDIADQVLAANTLYYLICNHSATTANGLHGWSLTTGSLLMAGIKTYSPGSVTLGSPATLANPAGTTVVPACAILTTAGLA